MKAHRDGSRLLCPAGQPTRRSLIERGATLGLGLLASRSPILSAQPRFLVMLPESRPLASLAGETFTRWANRYGFRIATERREVVSTRSIGEFDGYVLVGSSEPSSASAQLDDAMTAVARQVKRRGRPLLACHGAAGWSRSAGPRHESQHLNERRIHAFVSVLGGELVDVGPSQTGRVRLVDPSFPGAARMRDSLEVVDRWPALKNFRSDLHVVTVLETERLEGERYRRPPYPVSWARYHGKGRVFYSSFGATEQAWSSELMRQSLLGGLFWAMRDAEAEVSGNLKRVAPGANQDRYAV